MKKQLSTVKSLMLMDSRKVYHIISIALLVWFGIELVLQLVILSNSSLYNPDVYIVEEKTNYIYYMAYPFAKFINSCGIPFICSISWILVGSIPAWQLERYYTGNPVIYTWIRLPIKRWLLYIIKLIPAILFSIGIWLFQIILFWINYCIYLSLTENYIKTSNQWSQFISHRYIRTMIPLKEPIFFIPLIFLSVLVPAIFFLILLLSHSKGKKFLTSSVLLLGFIGLYSYLCLSTWSVLIVPVATIVVVCQSVYILNKVTIC